MQGRDLGEAGQRRGVGAVVGEDLARGPDLVLEVNQALDANPEKLNQSPYAEAWMMRLKLANPADAAGLLSAEDYGKLTG